MMKMTSFLSAAFSADILMILKMEPLLLILKLQQFLASMMATAQLMTGRMWIVPTGPGAPAARRPLG